MARRRAFAALLAALVIGLGAESALAHVTVEPTQGAPGGFVSYTFRVPNEKDIPTTSVRIEFPSDMVVSRFMPKPGWTRDVAKDQNGRTVGVAWTGGSLAADEFEEFSISARNPRQPGTFAFRAYQGYADGSVVEWVGPEGSDEPAPTVVIAEGAGPIVDAHGAPVGGGGAAPPSGGGNPTNPGQGGSAPGGNPTAGGSDLPLFVSLVSVVVAALALALAVVALTRRREPGTERPAAP